MELVKRLQDILAAEQGRLWREGWIWSLSRDEGVAGRYSREVPTTPLRDSGQRWASAWGGPSPGWCVGSPGGDVAGGQASDALDALDALERADGYIDGEEGLPGPG